MLARRSFLSSQRGVLALTENVPQCPAMWRTRAIASEWQHMHSSICGRLLAPYTRALWGQEGPLRRAATPLAKGAALMLGPVLRTQYVIPRTTVSLLHGTQYRQLETHEAACHSGCLYLSTTRVTRVSNGYS